MMIKIRYIVNMTIVLGLLCAVFWLLIANVTLAQEALAQETLGQETQRQNGLLYIYALALDNDPNAGASLETQYPVILNNFEQATINTPNTTIVAMIDLHNDEGTPDDRDHIVVIQNGAVVTNVHQLPTADGTLDPSGGQYEYDMVLPQQVGGFIKWARTVYGGQRTLFSYVGHGTFNPSFDIEDILADFAAVAPPTDAPDATVTVVPIPLPTLTPTPLPPRPPLPWLIDVTFAHTDAVTRDGSPQLLTPQLLAEALAIGIDGGEKFDVIDLVHCFSGSAEQYYEIAEYADVIVGSPNYGYIAADAFGKIIETVDVTMDSATMADTIIAGYAEILEQANVDWEAFGYEHPYVFSAVSGAQMEAVKVGVDGLANAIMAEFEANPEGTMTRLEVAQKTNGIFYDTSLCADPFVLSADDALVDMGTLSAALQEVFIAQSAVLQAAGQVDTAVANAVIAYQARDGVPWFAGEDAQMWRLEHESAVGMSMFAGLGAEVDEDGVIARPWQYNRYTSNVPTPFVSTIYEGERLKWITSDWTDPSNPPEPPQYNWANVVERYWVEKSYSSDVTTVDLDDETSACLPQLEIVQELGELTAETLIVNQLSKVYAGEEIILGGILNNEARLLTALTMFRAVALDGTELFSTTVSSSNLRAGRHWIEADETWTVPVTPFTLEMIVDANDHVIEVVEADNVAAVSFDALPASAGALLVTLDEQHQVSTDLEIDLRYAWGGSDMSVVDKISCQFYQLTPQNTPLSLIPTNIGHSEVDPVEDREPFSCPLPNMSNMPGAYQLIVSLVDSAGNALSSAAPVWVNHIPEQVVLPSGEAHTFVFLAEADDTFNASFTPSANWVSALLWKPNVIYPTNDLGVVGVMSDVADTAGLFTVSVNNPCPTSERYSLELSSGSSPTPPDFVSITCSLPLAVGTASQMTHSVHLWRLVVLISFMSLGTTVGWHKMRFAT